MRLFNNIENYIPIQNFYPYLLQDAWKNYYERFLSYLHAALAETKLKDIKLDCFKIIRRLGGIVCDIFSDYDDL